MFEGNRQTGERRIGGGGAQAVKLLGRSRVCLRVQGDCGRTGDDWSGAHV